MKIFLKSESNNCLQGLENSKSNSILLFLAKLLNLKTKNLITMNKIGMQSVITIITTGLLFFTLTFNHINASAIDYTAYKAGNAPLIDGVGNEECWIKATWAYINYPFDGKSRPDSADYYGRYKAVWTPSRLYVLMEITDDKIVDNRVNPSDNYWEDDCAEFFIDEDYSPQGHECGADAFNAFAYHIASVARDKNNYTNGSIVSFDSPNAIHHVIDLGTDCNTGRALNLDDHVVTKITKSGNKYTWELEFKIFDKNYNQTITTNTPVTLNSNKKMGFAIAYCDNDSGRRDNMVGTVPNHNDYSGKYPFYRFTNELGTLTLNDTILATSSVVRTNAIPRVIISPNPVSNTLNIALNNNNCQNTHLKIINLLGQSVLSSETKEINTQLELSGLKPGVYILEVSNSTGKTLQKFIKEKF